MVKFYNISEGSNDKNGKVALLILGMDEPTNGATTAAPNDSTLILSTKQKVYFKMCYYFCTMRLNEGKIEAVAYQQCLHLTEQLYNSVHANALNSLNNRYLPSNIVALRNQVLQSMQWANSCTGACSSQKLFLSIKSGHSRDLYGLGKLILILNYA
ncbi:uncharacterized protein RJT20DRAFT_136669 [Scheffersomyces xylosifermentans]|uniref:uncharacterized protein n=1 Tax=Scheffersomyces xylosifermentans TaxID=1304137 RepID=UPI00315C7FE1